MAYFNSLTVGGPINSLPQYEEQQGFKVSNEFISTEVYDETGILYGKVKNKIGLMPGNEYLLQFYTAEEKLIESILAEAESVELDDGNIGIILRKNNTTYIADGIEKVLTEDPDSGEEVSQLLSYDGYWAIHPTVFIGRGLGKISIIIEGLDDHNKSLVHQKEIPGELSIDLLPKKIKNLVAPDVSYTSLGYKFSASKGLAYGHTMDSYYMYPHRLGLKPGNTYRLSVSFSEKLLADLPLNEEQLNLLENIELIAHYEESLPGAIRLDPANANSFEELGIQKKLDKDKDDEAMDKAVRKTVKNKTTNPYLIDGVIINDMGDFELGDGVLLSSLFFNLIEYLLPYSESYGNLGDASMLYKIAEAMEVTLFGEDINDNPLTSDITSTPLYQANITGKAGGLGGLKLPMAALNNPCGHHVNWSDPTSGEVFNDYETGQAQGLYSHFEGKSEPEIIGQIYKLRGENNKGFVFGDDAEDIADIIDYKPKMMANRKFNSISNSDPALVLQVDKNLDEFNPIEPISILDNNKQEIKDAEAYIAIDEKHEATIIEKGGEREVVVNTITTSFFVIKSPDSDSDKEALVSAFETPEGQNNKTFYFVYDKTEYAFSVLNLIDDGIIVGFDSPINSEKVIIEGTNIPKDIVILETATGAFGLASHSEGTNTIALGNNAHAQGVNTRALGEGSFSAGVNTIANSKASAALGLGTETFAEGQVIVGKYNLIPAENKENVMFAVGGGNSDTYSTAMSVYADGTIESLQTMNAAGADYAEYYEWADGNPEAEDRRGLFVTFADEDKIRIATSTDDYILGVVSANASIIGNAYTDRWQGKYLTDIYGQRIVETIEHEEEIIRSEQEEVLEIIPAYTETRLVLNPEYDETVEYIGRNRRVEWTTIGTHGQLVIKDNGQCQVNGYCEPGEGGIAVPSQYHEYRVVKRLDENHIKVVLK